MTFETDINAWAAKVRNSIEDVPRLAAVAVAHDVRVPLKEGGNMPVRKGNLRNSLEATLNGVLTADIELGPDDMLSDPEAAIIRVVEFSNIGDTISLGFRVNYANEQERKHAFVRLTAQRWPDIVDAAIVVTTGTHP